MRFIYKVYILLKVVSIFCFIFTVAEKKGNKIIKLISNTMSVKTLPITQFSPVNELVNNGYNLW